MPVDGGGVLGADGGELAPMEGPQGQKTEASPMRPLVLKDTKGNIVHQDPEGYQGKVVRDDFGTAGTENFDAPPVASRPCPRCRTVHEVGKKPICICILCNAPGRLVWCGHCTECAYNRHVELFGSEKADLLPIFKEFVAYKKGQAADLLKDGMPWERG